jgi:hypothetical protein
MGERLGLLFSDGSLLVLAEGTDISTAWQEAAEHDTWDEPRTAVARLKIEITARYEPEVSSRGEG